MKSKPWRKVVKCRRKEFVVVNRKPEKTANKGKRVSRKGE